jgi:hypothetical protein
MTARCLALLAASLLTMSITAAGAQSDDAPAPPPAPHTTHHARAHHGPASDQVEQHIKRVHDELQITPSQGTQWEAFAQVMRNNARHMDGLYKGRAQVAATMNAVDSLKSYEQMAEAHLQDLQKLEPAFEALYNVMDDRQKRAADHMFQNNPAK